MSGKGSAPRPFSNRVDYDKNFDRIFGRKYVTEKCEFCAAEVQMPCKNQADATQCATNKTITTK